MRKSAPPALKSANHCSSVLRLARELHLLSKIVAGVDRLNFVVIACHEQTLANEDTALASTQRYEYCMKYARSPYYKHGVYLS